MKRWIKSLLLVPAVYSCAVAQDPSPQKYAELLTENAAKEHLTLLSSPAFEGRGTGQKGGAKAAQYIADHFKTLGLSAPVNNSYFQPLKLVRSSYIVESFSINKVAYINGKDFYIQGDNSRAAFNSNEVVFIGYGIQDPKHNDLKGLDIKGKVVLLINEGEPMDVAGNSVLTGTTKLSEWSTSRFKRIQELLKLEPKLILATGNQVGDMVKRFGSRMTSGRFMLDHDEAPIRINNTTPVINIKVEIADEILKAKKTSVAQQKIKPQSFNIKAKLDADMGLTQEKFADPNVLGFLEGSDLKNEIVVVSGHYDHDGINEAGIIFPGADDNGSGTVGVMELAKAFAQAKKEGKGPRRSILFIALAAEEKGLLGSQFYVENPVFPLATTVANVNLDMIGRIDDKHLNGDHNYIHVIGINKLSSDLKPIVEAANKDINLKLDYDYDDPNEPMRLYYRSDHYNFAKNGIPALFFFSGLHPDYHTPEDTVEKIDFPIMVKREKVIFKTVWEIANRTNKLIVDLPLPETSGR